MVADADLRIISFYLPQFYPNVYNNAWWGKGFTEWTNVAKAEPQFRGHYQPHLPADLGFYDLRVPETRLQQAELARQYGIHGFCYYHYWFHGQRMLERVVDEVIASGEPQFPLCLCWANETWTRRWGGGFGAEDILVEQTYSDQDDIDHIQYLIPIFQDDRYIRVNGRPLFIIYKTEVGAISQDRLARMLSNWEGELQKVGLELHLCSVRTAPPAGFRASIDFYPGIRDESPGDFTSLLRNKRRGFERRVLRRKHEVHSYRSVVEQMTSRIQPNYPRYSCPVPGWDNTARRADKGALILKNSTPELFEKWVGRAVLETKKHFVGEERILFVNAWNEWAEGCHLEPDARWGHQYLEALKRAMES